MREIVKIIALNKKHLKYLSVKTKKTGISNFLTYLISEYHPLYKNYDIKKGYARFIPRKGYIFTRKNRGAFSIFYVSATRYDKTELLAAMSGTGNNIINTKSIALVVEDQAKKIKESLDPDKIMIPKVKNKKSEFIKVKIR